MQPEERGAVQRGRFRDALGRAGQENQHSGGLGKQILLSKETLWPSTAHQTLG